MNINIPQEYIDKALKYLNGFDEISSIFIFGSTLTKTWDKSKDVDMAFLLKGKERLDQLLLVSTMLSGIFKKDVDIVILNNGDSITSYEARKMGAIIMDKDPDYRINFEVRAYKDYLDQKHRDDIYYKYAG